MKIGIDLGGSHIGVGLVNDDGILIIKRERDLINKDNIKQIIEETIVKYIVEILKNQNMTIENVDFIGIACPGSIINNKIKKMINLKIENWDLVSTLHKHFNTKIILKNDAKCAAICEKKYGNLKKYEDCIFLGIGTGIGGAVFIKNELLKPKNAEGFEIGHMIIKENGILCNCGNKGCFENYASITTLKKETKKALNSNKNITGLELYNIISENINDERLEKVIKEYIKNLAVGITNLVNIFEPEAICFGGSFTYYEELFFRKLQKEINEKNLLFNERKIDLITAKMKNDAGIIGAATIL